MGPSVEAFVTKNEIVDEVVIHSVLLTINPTAVTDKEILILIPALDKEHAQRIADTLNGEF